MKTFTNLSIEDEGELAKCIEDGRSVKLAGGHEVHAKWRNYEMSLEVMLITPDKKRRTCHCHRRSDGGKVILTKAGAALEMARFCKAVAREERS